MHKFFFSFHCTINVGGLSNIFEVSWEVSSLILNTHVNIFPRKLYYFPTFYSLYISDQRMLTNYVKACYRKAVNLTNVSWFSSNSVIINIILFHSAINITKFKKWYNLFPKLNIQIQFSFLIVSTTAEQISFSKILVKSQSLESNQTKIKNENCRGGFIESVHER